VHLACSYLTIKRMKTQAGGEAEEVAKSIQVSLSKTLLRNTNLTLPPSKPLSRVSELLSHQTVVDSASHQLSVTDQTSQAG